MAFAKIQNIRQTYSGVGIVWRESNLFGFLSGPLDADLQPEESGKRAEGWVLIDKIEHEGLQVYRFAKHPKKLTK